MYLFIIKIIIFIHLHHNSNIKIMVNLEWYRTFKGIFENGTLTKTAEALFTSQPGVSLHLNALESYIGKKLFDRTPRKMIPTEDGKILYQYINEAITQLESAEQHFKKSSQKMKPSLNMGMCSETFQFVLEDEIPHFDFDLSAKVGELSDLLKDLNNGILDLVITPKKSEKPDPSVTYTPFAKERIVLIAGKNTETETIQNLIDNKNMRELEKFLQQQKWYSAANEMEHFRRFWFDNFKKNPAFKPNFILPNINSVIRCLSDNEGFAIVPEFLCKEVFKKKSVKLVWNGTQISENPLYFAFRTDLQFKKELSQVEEIFKVKMN